MSKFSQPGNSPRSQSGMSLAAVLGFSIVLTLFTTALLSAMMPVLQKTAQFKGQGTARAVAEMGLDYAINQLNTGVMSADCKSSAGSYVNWTVPQTVLNDPLASVTIRVATLPSGNGNPPGGSAKNNIANGNSILADSLLDQSYDYAYRMVTATATYGATVKQVRALLQPTMVIPGTGGNGTNNTNPGNGGGNPGGGGGGPQPLAAVPGFPYGVFGVASVVYAGKAGYTTYNAADPRFGAEGGTLGKISQVYGGGGLGRSIVQGGSHYEFPDPQSYYAKQFGIVGNLYNATLASTAPWNTMTGNVYSNGNNTAYYPVSGTGDKNAAAFGNSPAHNVFGIQNGIAPSNTIPNGQKNGFIPQASPPAWTGGLSAWNPGPLNANGVTYPQPQIPATPNAPAGTPNLGAVNLSNATLVIDKTAPVPSGPIGSVKSGAVVKIPPGNYNINSLNLTNGAQIQIDSATQAAIASGAVPPASFYVSGTNNGSVVVNVDNTSKVNMGGISGTSINNTGNIGVTNSKGASLLANNQIAISPAGTSGSVAETSGAAGQLQLYYGGSSFNSKSSTYNTQVILSGNERMTVYAPNTGVLIGSASVGSGGPSSITSDANYYGAIVGGSVGINSAYDSGGGVYVHYDNNLRKAGMGGGQAAGLNSALGAGDLINPWSPPSTITFGGGGGSTVLAPNGYRAVSWQEAITPNAANPDAAQWRYNNN